MEILKEKLLPMIPPGRVMNSPSFAFVSTFIAFPES